MDVDVNMKIKENQYVIVKIQDQKHFIGRVKSVDDDSAEILPEKDIQYGNTALQVPKKNIRVNLGQSPDAGKVYGCDTTNLYKKTIDHDFWGNIHFFISPEKDTLKVLKTALESTAKVVTKLGLSDFTECFDTEIKAKNGKYAGMYKHSKSDDIPNTIWYAPECANGSKEYMEYVILHEFGHAVRFNGVKGVKLRSKWQSMYQRTIERVKLPSEDLKKIIKSISEYSEEEVSFIEAFKASSEDYGTKAQKAIVDWLKQSHKLNMRDAEVMWRAGNLDGIKELWPDHLIDSHDLKPIISTYATKSVEELFAETFAFYCQKKKIPRSLEELIERSITIAKTEIKK